MWTYEQHPPKEEVKVDSAQVDGASERLLACFSAVCVAEK